MPTLSSLWQRPGATTVAPGRSSAPSYVMGLGLVVVAVVVVAGLAIGTGERQGRTPDQVPNARAAPHDG